MTLRIWNSLCMQTVDTNQRCVFPVKPHATTITHARQCIKRTRTFRPILHPLTTAGTEQTGGNWNRTDWRQLKQNRLEATETEQTGGNWNRADYRQLEQSRLEATETEQTGGNWNRADYRQLEQSRLEATETEQTGKIDLRQLKTEQTSRKIDWRQLKTEQAGEIDWRQL